MILYHKKQSMGHIDRETFRTIQPLLAYWGLAWNENENLIDQALKGQSFSIAGLADEEFHEVKKFLAHTGAELNSTKGLKQISHIKVSFIDDQPVPIVVQTEGKDLLFITPRTEPGLPVQAAIHRNIVCKRRNKSYFFSFRSKEKKNAPEWISYLLIQIALSDQFAPLTSVSLSDYKLGIKKILLPINPYFASIQSTDTIHEVKQETMWPAFPPESLINSKHSKQPKKTESQQTVKTYEKHSPITDNTPINPFRTNKLPTETINPFKEKNKKYTSVINPFQQTTYTIPEEKE
ncbi:hypothetical protein [Fictibacillus terranigra]|uniref:Uncharacterized protein n=1 Tax=Fictibacillus terranigra TaxID=3058424 RepID=A0ABT8E6W7_9BACL|nr:hypothetical protein [Fictibacillus sp. CENA-BCM004]MDN4073653.1 hypothetical protein [Fictibacillus sp. CENA-BCM004]